MSSQAKPHTNQSSQRKPSALWDRIVYIGFGANVIVALVVVTAIGLPLSATQPTTAAQATAQASQLTVGLQNPAPAQPTVAVSNISLNTDPVSTIGGDAANQAAFDPVVIGQGGTCITGRIIDNYEQERGAGWEITVQKISPTQESAIRMTADPNGRFTFPSLSAGTYRVTLEFPPEWRPYTPDTFEVTLNGVGPECAEVRFKMEALANLEVTKLDNGGNADLKQKIGIPGWTITMTTPAGGVPLVEETNGAGKAFFRNLAPGTWIVTEEDKVGWQPAPGSQHQVIINLDSPRVPGTFASLTFVNEQINNARVVVDKLDTGNRPLPGWTFTLIRKDGTHPNQGRVTGQDGKAEFNDLPLGDWIVTHGGQPWWQPVGAVQQEVTLDTPGETKQVTFVNEALGCIDGYKINHLEQGLGGWQITRAMSTPANSSPQSPTAAATSSSS